MNCIGFIPNEQTLLQSVLPNFQTLYIYLVKFKLLKLFNS